MTAASAPAIAGRTFAASIAFEVAGDPVPQGSKQAYVVKGRAVVTERGRATLGPWRGQIAAAALEACSKPLEGPVAVHLTFTLTRPKSHYREGRHAGELKPAAPLFVSTRPDIDKLSRAVLDALTGSALRDDGQVAELTARKIFGPRAGVAVALVPLETTP